MIEVGGTYLEEACEPISVGVRLAEMQRIEKLLADAERNKGIAERSGNFIALTTAAAKIAALKDVLDILQGR